MVTDSIKSVSIAKLVQLHCEIMILFKYSLMCVPVQKYYEGRLALRVAQSCQRVGLMCYGSGVEPNIIFDRPVVEFSPVIPHYAVEEEIVICNPCTFPIELYNLEYDKVYLEDEKVGMSTEQCFP